MRTLKEIREMALKRRELRYELRDVEGELNYELSRYMADKIVDLPVTKDPTVRLLAGSRIQVVLTLEVE